MGCFQHKNAASDALPEYFLIPSVLYQSIPYCSIYCMTIASLSMVSFMAVSLVLQAHWSCTYPILDQKLTIFGICKLTE